MTAAIGHLQQYCVCLFLSGCRYVVAGHSLTLVNGTNRHHPVWSSPPSQGSSQVTFLSTVKESSTNLTWNTKFKACTEVSSPDPPFILWDSRKSYTYWNSLTSCACPSFLSTSLPQEAKYKSLKTGAMNILMLMFKNATNNSHVCHNWNLLKPKLQPQKIKQKCYNPNNPTCCPSPSQSNCLTPGFMNIPLPQSVPQMRNWRRTPHSLWHLKPILAVQLFSCASRTQSISESVRSHVAHEHNWNWNLFWQGKSSWQRQKVPQMAPDKSKVPQRLISRSSFGKK